MALAAAKDEGSAAIASRTSASKLAGQPLQRILRPRHSRIHAQQALP
jgi:hypothetical protein